MRRQRFVKDHEREHNVIKLCELMDIPKSGFYAWRGRPKCDRVQRDEELTETISAVHTRSRRTYGAPRVRTKACISGANEWLD